MKYLCPRDFRRGEMEENMFLNQLSNKEKKAFINLSMMISKSNGVFDEAEQEMIQAYCKEMEIAFSDSEEADDIEDIVTVFKTATDHVKRIVILESLGLAYSDGQLDSKEDMLMRSFAEKIGIDEDTYKEIAVLLNKYIMVLKELTAKI